MNHSGVDVKQRRCVRVSGQNDAFFRTGPGKTGTYELTSECFDFATPANPSSCETRKELSDSIFVASNAALSRQSGRGGLKVSREIQNGLFFFPSLPFRLDEKLVGKLDG